MNSDNQMFTHILEQLYQKTGKKHDVHYEQGKGALITLEGREPTPQNVVLRLGEMHLNMARMSGGKINFE